MLILNNDVIEMQISEETNVNTAENAEAMSPIIAIEDVSDIVNADNTNIESNTAEQSESQGKAKGFNFEIYEYIR